MTAPTGQAVREIVLDAGGVPLSGLLAVPTGPPRAVVVALHGGGMRAGYFHGTADPACSFLALAAARGYTALALDRPGYGHSAAKLPQGASLARQTALLRAALERFGESCPTGAGLLLLGHSLGGKLALTAAAHPLPGLLGVDVSGVGNRWATHPDSLRTPGGRGTHHLHWGPPALYPPGTFRLAERLVTAMPVREAREIPDWPRLYAGLAERVTVPVRLTFAEHERWWRCDERALGAMTSVLVSAASVRTERLPGAGHNISLGLRARAYHQRVLAFLEECLGPRARDPG
ncbi:alpha/beta hydrolase [Streptomyces iconiensis]|uniref:Alpha/beta fold hydrolase n=1 Tax=Streptomyces iconiensis TaxID=1384038 RepID=A0ABT7A116_9ACTN|nr:alpha/beta fold hydrolase [Streptomyces iconiensis]MDJ1135001.1 alpha/beta fold hydrolase [Streptomyces iconiensis]